MGTMLPSGHFYCSKHIGEADEIIEGIEIYLWGYTKETRILIIICLDFKKTLNWPGDVPYLFENDWSAISYV